MIEKLCVQFSRRIVDLPEAGKDILDFGLCILSFYSGRSDQ